MKTNFWLMVGKIITFLLIFPLITLAQDNEPKIRVDTNLVNVNVLITNKNGQPVKGLGREQFEIYDNNIKQQIEHFSGEKTPLSFGVVYDLHPTSGDSTRAVINSLRQFSKESLSNDEIMMFAFNMNGMQKFDFIPTVEQLEIFLQNPEKRQPNSLYDVIYALADTMRVSRQLKQTILVISDSVDHSSRHSFTELSRRLKSLNIEIYAIILVDDKWFYSDIFHHRKKTQIFTDASTLDRAAVQDLALKSGGTYFSESPNTFQLFSIYRQIADEMNNHYTIGFYPEKVDEKPHSLKIKLRGVKDSKNFVLTYRQDYLLYK